MVIVLSEKDTSKESETTKVAREIDARVQSCIRESLAANMPKLEELDPEAYRKLTEAGLVLGAKLEERMIGIMRETTLSGGQPQAIIPVSAIVAGLSAKAGVEIAAVVVGVVAGDVAGTIASKKIEK